MPSSSPSEVSAPLHRRWLPWLWALLPASVGSVFCWVLYQIGTDYDLWNWAHRWRWSPWWPFYNDLTITLGHLQEAFSGRDILADPKSDYAYPRAFLLLRFLHLQDIPSPIVGTVQAGLWMASVIYLLRPRSFTRALLTTAIYFAPPFVLGLEQGNFDLVLFLLMLVLGSLWARPGPQWASGLAVLAGVAAAFLKMYPVFVLAGGAWADTARRRLLWVGGMLLVGGYWATHAEEIQLITSKLHLGNGSSWGCLLIFNRTLLHNIPYLWTIAVIVYTVAFVGALIAGHHSAHAFANHSGDRTEWAYYWIGTAICCGSFVATNYDYRWVFALLTLPLLLRLARQGKGWPALWARLSLLSLTVSLAAPLYLNPQKTPFLAVQVANWVYVLLLALGFMALRQHYLPAQVPAKHPA